MAFINNNTATPQQKELLQQAKRIIRRWLETQGFGTVKNITHKYELHENTGQKRQSDAPSVSINFRNSLPHIPRHILDELLEHLRNHPEFLAPVKLNRDTIKVLFRDGLEEDLGEYSTTGRHLTLEDLVGDTETQLQPTEIRVERPKPLKVNPFELLK